MSGIESLIKYAVGMLGIPVLTQIVGGAFTASKVLETGTHSAQRASARAQMLSSGDWTTEKLCNAIVLPKGQQNYGDDYAFFSLSGYDGALKMLDGSGPGDLYLIRWDGGEYFIYSRSGLPSLQSLKTVDVLAHLPKRGSTVDAAQLTEFFKPLAAALVSQHERIQAFKRSNPRPFAY